MLEASRAWHVLGALVLGAPGFLAAVRAEPLPGAGGLVTVGLSGRGESHAWVVLPDERSSRSMLMHIPPRGAASAGYVPDGRVSVAARIEEPPELIAAWDSTVYLAFAPEQVRGTVLRRVLRVTATASPIGDRWTYDTEEGVRDRRLMAAPSMPGGGRLLGFVGSAHGSVALLGGAKSDPDGGLTLYTLDGEQWIALGLPQSRDGPAPGLAPPPILVSTAEGPALFIRDRTDPGLWVSSIRRVENPETGQFAPRAEWTWRPLPFAEGAASSLTGPAFEISGRLVVIHRQGPGSLLLWSAAPSGVYVLGRVAGLSGPCAAAPLDESKRIILVCPIRKDDAPAARPGRPDPPPRYEYHIREISALTGQELYSGRPASSSPVSAAEFRLLVVVLLAVTVGILLFVLRPAGPGSKSTPLVLPARLVLAEPGRRIAAALLDLAPSIWLASRLSGVSFSTAFSPDGLFSPSGALVLLLDGMAIAFVHTTLCECFFGRSLGKSLLGCEVVRITIVAGPEGQVQPQSSRPGFWRAVVRNMTKWGLAPVAFAGLSTPEHRHVGDRLAGTVVVVPRSTDEGV